MASSPQNETARRALRGFLVLATTVIALATLTPAGGGGGSGPSGCIAICGSRGLADFVSNIFLFLPFGVALGGLGHSPWRALLLGLAFSLGIEMAQVSLIAGRDATTSDVISNATGALLGGWIGVNWVRWASMRSPAVRVYLAACVVGLLALVAATGALFQPVDSPRPLTVDSNRGQGAYAAYPGRVLETKVNDRVLAGGQVSAAAMQGLLSGDTFTVSFEAAAPEWSLRRIAAITDGARDVLLLGAENTDVLVQYRARSSSYLLDEPTLRLENALSPGNGLDTVEVSLWRGAAGFCASDGNREVCARTTAASSWMFMRNVRPYSEQVKAVINCLWMAILLVPIGFFARFDAPGAAWLSLLGAGLVLLPGIVGLAPTPAIEWLAALAGMAAGVLLRTLSRQRAASATRTIRIRDEGRS